MKGWDGWYHVMVTTYGQWVRGDPRGWRARHHREHCEGDYKHRPDPDLHRAKYKLSKELMTRNPVRLSDDLCDIVCDALSQKFIEFGCDPIVIAIGSKHGHVLARFPSHDPRIKTGIAKQHATTTLKAHCSAVGIDLRLKLGEGIWGKRSKAEPIKDRAHQVKAFYYVVRHVREGVALWLRDDLAPKRAKIIERAFSRRREQR
jgi:hypothetical protein